MANGACDACHGYPPAPRVTNTAVSLGIQGKLVLRTLRGLLGRRRPPGGSPHPERGQGLRRLGHLPPLPQRGSGGTRRAPVKQGNKYGYIDRTGKMVIPLKFDDALPFKQGLASVKVNGKYGNWGFIDKSGKMVIPAQFQNVTMFNDGAAAVKKQDGSWCVIDISGKQAIGRGFPTPPIFSEGLAAFREGDKWGYMNKSGAVAIPPQFDAASIFMDGLAPVKMGEKCGFVDAAGKLVIPAEFEWAPNILEQYVSYYSALR